MNWNNYIHNNSKNKMDCQLVTAINAYYHLTGKTIKQNSKLYKRFIELSGCKYGSCINIKKVWDELGITEKERFQYNDLNKYLKQNSFIEINVWHKRNGFHSTSIVDYYEKTNSVRITNFYEASEDGWILIKTLKPFMCLNPDKIEPRWHCRTLQINNLMI